MSKPTPLGTLFKLPPELRDRIYDHVLDKSYVVFWDYYLSHHQTSARRRSPISFAKFEIRCISKALSAEATARLFSNKTSFIFVITFNYLHDLLSSPPNKKATERMVDVEFRVQTGASTEAHYIWCGQYLSRGWIDRSSRWDDVISMITADGEKLERRTVYYPSNVDPRCEASVDQFTGIEIERNKLLVTFADFNEHFHLFMPTRFFQTLKKCVAFRSIVVVLEWWDVDEQNPRSMAVAEKVEEVQRELEQCWGPCVARDALAQYSERIVENYILYSAFELAFQPLKFREENAEAAGAVVMKEAHRLEELS